MVILPALAQTGISGCGSGFNFYTAGDRITAAVETLRLHLRYVPAGKYYVGENPVQEENVEITRNYAVGETEVTYELWYTVKTWALENGYKFICPGREGHDGTDGAAPTQAKNEPVTNILWHDAIVWCNALSEMQGLAPAYTFGGEIIRDSTDIISCDNAKFDYNATGYRLPTETEWEIACRGGGIAYADNTYGNLYSGSNSIDEVAWSVENTGEVTHDVALKHPNQLGIYDMSGNVWEWCWDWHSSSGYPTLKEDPLGGEVPDATYARTLRGGAYDDDESCSKISSRAFLRPQWSGDCMGFRITRTM